MTNRPTSGRSVHDLGGDAAGPVAPTDHEREDWEKRTDAMGQLLRRAGLVRLDEIRRNIEALGGEYHQRSYGERTLHGLTQTLMQRGAISAGELGERLTEVAKRMHHDMGGLPADRVAPEPHDYEAWEKRVDALMILLSRKHNRLLRVDELRKNIEALGPEVYDRLGYYERWMHSIGQTLLQRGVVSSEEIERKLEEDPKA
jgi:tetrahydromethanopterin S-methyltransferase subunit G